MVITLGHQTDGRVIDLVRYVPAVAVGAHLEVVVAEGHAPDCAAEGTANMATSNPLALAEEVLTYAEGWDGALTTGLGIEGFESRRRRAQWN